MSNFKPEIRSYETNPYETNAERMEASKANFTTSLLTSEICSAKCNLMNVTANISPEEGDCLRMCFIKYFDCRLLIENENTNFVTNLDL